MDDFFTRALPYIEMGWKVFPVRPDKVPLCAHGRNDATCASVTIEDWSESYPDANIGVKTGKDGGLAVLDIDSQEGEDWIASVNNSWARLPEAPTAISGRGRHLYFAYPRISLLKSSVGKLAPGVDIRASGGSITAPVSLHASGKLYEWIIPPFGHQLPPFPEWMVRKVAPRPPRVNHPGLVQNTSPQRVRSLLDQVCRSPNGERNHTLNRVAFIMGLIVRDGGLSQREALDGLVQAGVAAGLPKFEARTTSLSGLKSGLKTPIIR